MKVESPADFRAWLAAQAAPATPAEGRGATVFQSCAACHAIRGAGAAGRAGPDLTHVAARRSLAAGTLAMTRGNLEGWIEQPHAVKPGTSMPQIPLTPADADAVAAYLARLR
ncbi:c-type cytochrome [Sphingomonas sp. DT-51]|uniref:c-type cytochrome n=1 Tax=Sphingomonas sp. DT-51 TaxID=3396165 RepID=UPI003F541346